VAVNEATAKDQDPIHQTCRRTHRQKLYPTKTPAISTRKLIKGKITLHIHNILFIPFGGCFGKPSGSSAGQTERYVEI
jgi:hypothetical protein